MYPVLKQGSTGPYVIQLKQRLGSRGLTTQDGPVFEVTTRKAVIEFQKVYTAPDGTPLEPDGVVGQMTWDALGGPPEPIVELAGPRGYAVASFALWEATRGVREQGSNTGPDVRVYQRATGRRDTGWKWCAAFVTWCYEQAGLFLNDTNGFTVVNDLAKWGQRSGFWRKREEGYVPPVGAIAIFKFSHTGIVVQPGGLEDRTVEGNTSAGEGGSQADGDGVYQRTRQHSLIKGYVVMPEIVMLEHRSQSPHLEGDWNLGLDDESSASPP